MLSRWWNWFYAILSVQTNIRYWYIPKNDWFDSNKFHEFINTEFFFRFAMIDSRIQVKLFEQMLQCQHCSSSLGCILGHGRFIVTLSAKKNVVAYPGQLSGRFNFFDPRKCTIKLPVSVVQCVSKQFFPK